MIECIRYSDVNKSTCVGVATIFVEKWGVELSGISLHQKEGKRWINLPARKVEEEGGEVKYYQYIRFPKREHRDKFCEVVKKAIDVFRATMPTGEITEKEECPF